MGKTAKDVATLVERARKTLARRLKAEGARTVAKPVNRSAARVASQITVTTGSGHVRLTASGKRPGLQEFGGRWAGRASAGATAQIYSGGPRQVFTGAFIRRDSGKLVTRVGSKKGGKSGRVARGPLRTLTGPSPADVMRFTGAGAVYEQLVDIGEEVLAAEMNRVIAGLLK